MIEELFAAAEVPGVDGIDGFDAEAALDLEKIVALEFPEKDLAAAFPELAQGGGEAFEALLALGEGFGIGARVGKAEVLGRDVVWLAVTPGFAIRRHHLVAQDLEAEREQVLEGMKVRILRMEHKQHLLGEILGGVPS